MVYTVRMATRHRTFHRRLPGLAALLLLLAPGMARAERVVFQRGEALYLGPPDGKESRRFLTVGSASETLWAMSPDGRRVAWARRAPGAGDTGLTSRPLVLSLSDILGRRQKRLCSTEALRDRLGRKVSAIGAGGASTRLEEWQPLSLSWSGDGRTLYVGCIRVGEPVAMTTVAVDAVTGSALVDAEGRWKAIAPAAQADARAALLAAVGSATSEGQSGPEASYAPLLLVNLGEGRTTPLPDPQTLAGEKPVYGAALWPAFAPDGKTIAFASIPRGLWLADLAARSFRRLVHTDCARPRWTPDGKGIYFLAPRPSVGDRISYDLYLLPLAGGAPQQLQQNIDWFDLIPE